MNRLIRESKGSVSVFFIIVTAAVFLFMAVFIDYARIAAFNKMTESAARAGVRSVLSAFDRQLYERYGLFGRGGSDGNGIFEGTVRGHLEKTGGGEAFRLTDGRVTTAAVDVQFTLAVHEALLGQVLEEMKYKAPVDFAMEMAGRFRPLSGAVMEAARTHDLLERMRQLYDSRQRHLTAAFEAMRDAGANSAGMMKTAETAADAAAGYPAYAEWTAADAGIEEGGKPQHALEIGAYRSRALSASSSAAAQSRSVLAAHSAMQAEAMAALTAAEADNTAMKALTDEARRQSSAPGVTSGAPVERSVEASEAETVLKEIRGTADQMLLPAAWFNDYREDIGKLASSGDELSAAAARFAAALNAAVSASDPSLASGLSDMASAVNGACTDYNESIRSASGLLARRESAIRDSDSAGSVKKEYEAKAAEKWREAGSLLRRFSGLSESDSERAEFRKLEELRGRNAALNDAGEETSASEQSGAGVEAEITHSSANEAAGSALDRTGEMFDRMSDHLASERDKLYLGEYTIGRFNAFTPDKMKAALQSAGGAEPGSPTLQEQEAEYILYGLTSSSANVGAAYGEVFAFRLGVRTMEGLIKCRSLGHPLVVLAAALAYGMEQAVADMAMFLDKGAAPLSAYAKIDVSYKDYLRMFLQVQGTVETRLSRISAVIEYNTGYDLSAVPAAISGEVTASAKLWFLPGVMRTLGRAGILSGKVAAGRYETTKTASLSY